MTTTSRPVSLKFLHFCSLHRGGLEDELWVRVSVSVWRVGGASGVHVCKDMPAFSKQELCVDERGIRNGMDYDLGFSFVLLYVVGTISVAFFVILWKPE